MPELFIQLRDRCLALGGTITLGADSLQRSAEERRGVESREEGLEGRKYLCLNLQLLNGVQKASRFEIPLHCISPLTFFIQIFIRSRIIFIMVVGGYTNYEIY